MRKLSQHYHPTISLYAANLLKVWACHRLVRDVHKSITHHRFLGSVIVSTPSQSTQLICSCTVRFFSQGEKPAFSGDPFQDFTLVNFLNKFVFKNPKSADKSKCLRPFISIQDFYDILDELDSAVLRPARNVCVYARS